MNQCRLMHFSLLDLHTVHPPPSVLISQYTSKAPVSLGSIQYTPSPREYPLSNISSQESAAQAGGAAEGQARRTAIPAHAPHGHSGTGLGRCWGQALLSDSCAHTARRRASSVGGSRRQTPVLNLRDEADLRFLLRMSRY